MERIVGRTRRVETSKRWPQQTVLFAFTATGIILLALGNAYEVPTLEVAALVVLVVGFAYMIITSRSIFRSEHKHPPVGY